ncbi:OmpP1/FadL family transporter [Nonlabens sp. SY33080]|uniref:OmpP1/FadL family transporter n=1 Tax=Nonlabens sp. SY33080 TaxID=2719911 RepID=UPI001428B840|nr:outer membrane protein transport protein [Nonlabens sp. SY33080]
MKKAIIIGALALGALFSSAQSVQEGLTYTPQDIYGTARFRALSGAMGSLGGDLSAIGVNPAGSTVFANNYVSLSLNVFNQDADTDYFGSTSNDGSTDVTINQVGGVLVFEGNNESGVTKFSLGINYDALRNYDTRLFFNGVSDTSISQYFLNNANGITLDNLQLQNGETVSGLYRFLGENVGFDAQQAFLGYEAFIINAVDDTDPNNIDYVSNTGNGPYNQTYFEDSNGYQNKTSFNGALEIDNKFSLGLNVNIHYLFNEKFTRATENSNGNVSRTRFDNVLRTDGSGVSFQLGTIAKVTKQFRLGLSYESPTWYTIEDNLVQEIEASGANINAVVAPRVENLFAPYDLRLPGSWTASASYVFGKKGIISLDYGIRDYTNMKFSPENDFIFSQNNQFISNNLDTATTLRIGGEYRVKNWSLRGGYRMIDSPYKDKSIVDDLTGYSLGLGYSWGNTVLDLSYDYSEQDFSQNLASGGLDTSGNVQNSLTNIVLTLGFNL